MFDKVKSGLLTSFEAFIALITGLLVVDVVWQVVTRYLFGNPSDWTEELATTLLIWVSLLGATLAFIRTSHLGIDYFVGKLGTRARARVDILIYTLIATFSVTILIFGGYLLISNNFRNHQVTPAMGLPRAYINFVLPLSGLFILGFSIGQVIEKCLFLAGKKRSA